MSIEAPRFAPIWPAPSHILPRGRTGGRAIRTTSWIGVILDTQGQIPLYSHPSEASSCQLILGGHLYLKNHIKTEVRYHEENVYMYHRSLDRRNFLSGRLRTSPDAHTRKTGTRDSRTNGSKTVARDSARDTGEREPTGNPSS